MTEQPDDSTPVAILPSPYELSYVAGVWEARGGGVIAQSAAYYGVRLWVETLARREVLDRMFGEPTERTNYRRAVWRYEATDRVAVRQIAASLIPHVGSARAGELQALIDFCAAVNTDGRAAAATALDAARLESGTGS